MPVNPRQDETQVKQQAQAQAPAPDARQVAREMIDSRIPAGSVDPATLQVLMALMAPVLQQMQVNNLETVKLAIQEMRKPTPEEEAKLLQEKERQKQRSISAAKAGELEAAIIKSQQNSCPHLKPNGEHTFRGQVHANGWAVIKCQRCYVRFNVRPLPEQIQNGLNLGEIKGLTIQHLRQWQKDSGEIDRRIRASQDAMRGMETSFSTMAPHAVGL